MFVCLFLDQMDTRKGGSDDGWAEYGGVSDLQGNYAMLLNDDVVVSTEGWDEIGTVLPFRASTMASL